jgi:pyridinium-3,5-bisthiocarboxylic acid mononucleotide nickel chelatase
VTTTCWFGCATSGVAGDMLLGSLLDAGADLAEVRAIVGTLGLDGWHLDAEPVTRGGIAATRAVVHAPEEDAHRTWAEIRALLARLPGRVHARAHAAFIALAEVEAGLHRTSIDDVHFHEVGALDAIVDIVGTCAALEVLGVDEVAVGPVATGHGTTTAAHGNLPVPAPATAALLVGLDVVGVDVAAELATPTGAALVRTLGGGRSTAVPAMTVTATGFGAGRRELDGRPNVVQVLVGTAGTRTEALLQLEANVDDVTGEVLAHAVEQLLAAGALDAWATPIVMKKGRPAHTVAALVRPADEPRVRQVLTAETGTLGVRVTAVERHAVDRGEDAVEVDGHRVRIKVTAERAKAEFDDAAAAAAATGRPVREVLARAEAAYSGRDDSARQSER